MRRGRLFLAGMGWLFVAVAAAPQARISDVIPEGGAVEAERLGSAAAEPVGPDAEFVAGDLLSSVEEDAVVVLECPPESGNLYNLAAPFRVLIAVPEEVACHIDMLGGDVDVLAEEPTEVSVGGVEMRSVGTQYAVRVWREQGEAERKLVVYDGEMEVREQAEVKVVGSGRTLVLKARLAEVEAYETPDEEATRSARVYSRVDLAIAKKRVGTLEDDEALQQKLQSLHFDVLRQPKDEPKRAELARVQAQYEVTDRALYHLKQIDAVNEAGLQRYSIDRGKLEQGASQRNKLYLSTRLATVLPPVERRTTDSDLELIREGRAREALAGLEHRFRDRTATSRDAYAYALAYRALGDAERSSGWAARALRLHDQDGRLGPEEQTAMRRLASR